MRQLLMLCVNMIRTVDAQLEPACAHNRPFVSQCSCLILECCKIDVSAHCGEQELVRFEWKNGWVIGRVDYLGMEIGCVLRQYGNVYYC